MTRQPCSLRRRALRCRSIALGVVLVVTAAPGGSAVYAAVPVTFGEALARLRRENGNLRAAADELEQRRQEQAAARGLYLPRIEATATATWIDDPIVLDLEPIRSVILQLHPGVPEAAVPPFRDRIQEDSFQRMELRGTWPVYTGGRVRAANQAAAARLDDAAEQRRGTEQSLTSELVRRFFGLRLAQRVVEVRAEVRDGLAAHLRQARRLADEGQIADAQRLHAEVAYAAAERDWRAAQRDLAIVRAALAGIMAARDSLEAATPLFLLSSIEPLLRYQESAAAANSGLRRLDSHKALAAAGMRAATSAWLPDVYLFGQREMLTGDLTVLDPEWAAGVGARWTLFDGSARLRNWRAARFVTRQVEDLSAQARSDLGILVTRRYEEVHKALEAYQSLDASLAAATENVRARDEGFAEGMATSLDVTDARLELARVRVERLAAAYCFDVALAELLEASGQSDRLPEYMQRADVEVDR